MKKMLLFLILVVSTMSVAQDISGKIPQNEIDRVKSLIIAHYREEATLYPQYDSVWFINIYHVGMDGESVLSMNNLKDGSFLAHVEPIYIHYTKNWLKRHGFSKLYDDLIYGQFMLANCEGELILGLTQWDGLHFYDAKTDRYHKELPRIVLEYGIFSLYHFVDRDSLYYIGVTDQKEVLVLRYVEEGIQVFNADEYDDKDFPYLFPDDINRGK